MSEVKKHAYTREQTGLVGRARRFAKKRASAGAMLRDLGEEGFVRLMDKPFARNIMAGFSSQREPEKWVFLVGCYNSGTTLLQKILSAHPDIAALPREGVRFTRHLSNLELNGHHMFWDESWREHAAPPPDHSENIARLIKRDWSVFWKRGAKIHMDKSVANTARIEWLEKYFPNASFIGIHRNGYCIAEGLHRRSRPPQWLQDRTGLDHYPLTMAGEQWVTANEAMLEGFEKVDQKLLVSFEELVADPAALMERISAFLGLSAPRCTFADGVLKVNGKDYQVHDPNPESLKRLGSDGMKELHDVIAPMMTRLGYSQ